MTKRQYAEIICCNKFGNLNGPSCKLNQIEWFKQFRRIYRNLQKLTIADIERSFYDKGSTRND